MRIKTLIFLMITLGQVGYSAVLPQYSGTYRVTIPTQPVTFDPARVSTPVERSLTANLYDRLVAFDEGNQPIPALAETWSTSADGLLWTFRLRSTVKFHTGRMLIADDVKYSIERLVAPSLRAPKSWLFSSISGYREYISGQTNQISGIIVPNKTTIQIRLLKPNPNLLSALGSVAASIVAQEDISNSDTLPIGTGAFMFSEQTGKYIRIIANPEYWEGRPYLDEVRFIVSENPGADLLEFELGNLEECSVPEEEFHRLAEQPHLQSAMLQLQIPNVAYLGFNLTKSPMTDIKFRQAVRYAIDRQGILDIVLNHHGTLIQSPVIECESELEPLEYSIISAQHLFQSFPKRMLSLVVNQSDLASHHIAQRIQVGLLESGYPIQVEELNLGEFSRRIRDGNYDLFYCHYYPDMINPELIFRALFFEKNFGTEGNQTFYYHPQVEFLLDSAKTSLDVSEQIKYLNQIAKLIQQDIPLLFFFQAKPYILRQKYIQNLNGVRLPYQTYKNVWYNYLINKSTRVKATPEP